ncbi:MAG TPA: FRG domain-containing protein [Flavisolibacter sp.]|nr:FRG domain-containing protein [Flavisolibacter sp.]
MGAKKYEYTTIRLKSWNEYKSFIQQFSENWAFRGQANAEWVLNNAIERTDFIKFHKGVEADFLAEFQRGARNYLSRDEIPEHLIEWLALMQHHGAPTRLLDLTRSPYISAFFGFEQCTIQEGHFIGIWGLNINYLKERAVAILSKEFEEALQETKNLINEKLFEKIFIANDRKLVFPVEPFRMNRRYSLQQSVFVSTGISEIPLMEQLLFLKENMKKAVVKIEIPTKFKKEALRDLQQMNLHRASLFPDLDGYAASLRLRYNSMKTPVEAKEEIKQKMKDKNYKFFP